MATYFPAKRATAWRGWVALVDQSNTKKLKSSATLAAGDVKVSKDGGATANLTTLPVVTPSASVFIQVDLSATEMTADNVAVSFIDAAGAEWCDLFFNLQTTARQIDDLCFPNTSGRGLDVNASGDAEADVKTWLGTAPNALTSGRVDSLLGAVTAAAIGSAAFAANALGAMWDELLTGHTTAGSYGEILQPTRRATAQAGAAGTITLDASASATDNFYNDQIVYIISSTGAGQARVIQSYVGSTKVATITPNWATNPSATSVFAIFPDARKDVGVWVGGATIPAVLAASGRMESNVSAMANNVISAAVLASAASAEIGAACWDELASAHVTALTMGALLQPVRAATAQAGAAGTITLDASSSAVDDFYNDSVVNIYAGTGVGQSRFISAYVGSSKVASVVPNWATNPDNTSKFQIIQGGRTGLAEWVGSVPNALISGRVDASIGATQTGAIAAAGLAADLDVYTAFVWMTRDAVTPSDRYMIVWFKNGVPVTSGITSPALTVINESNTTLVSAVTPTNIGTSGVYKWDEPTNRITIGVAYYATATATIDGSTRTWETPLTTRDA